MNPHSLGIKSDNFTAGFCKVLFAPVRRTASETAEMVSQLIFGEAVKIIQKTDKWLEISAIWDNYTGWVDVKTILQITHPKHTILQPEAFFRNNQKYTPIRIIEPVAPGACKFSNSLALPPQPAINIIEICNGARLPIIWDMQTADTQLPSVHYLASTKDLPQSGNISAFYPQFELLPAENTGDSNTNPSPTVYNTLLAHSPQMPFGELLQYIIGSYLHTPYLWGGRACGGIDCSGLVQMVYSLAFPHFPLPRDAKDQALYGKEVSFEDAQTGDLAFFHNPEGKITHVGILLHSDDKQKHIAHASGMVRIDILTDKGICIGDYTITPDAPATYSHNLHSIRSFR